MTDILALWRSPLDKVALSAAAELLERQPRCSIELGEDFSAMTIYNYAYYYTQEGATDSSALTAMLSEMGSADPVGGVAFVEQDSFAVIVPATGTGFSVPSQCNLVGSGGGGLSKNGPFYHFSIDFTDGPQFFRCTGKYTSGGTCFRSLAFLGDHSTTSVGDACIYAATENCRAIACTFTNIPTAFNAQGTCCSLQQCTIAYEDGPYYAVAVIIGGSQCGVLGPGEFFQRPQSQDGAPQGCVCISVQGPADHTVIGDLHVSDWNIGVDFSQAAGATNTHIRNCEIQCYQTALNIQLPGNAEGAYTTGIKVTSCTLAKTNDNVTDSHAVVLIDPALPQAYNSNEQLSDITLLDCTVFNQGDASGLMSQHGLAILGGQNIKVIGGTYSNNSPMGGAGIAILGAVGDVQIIGANLQPSYTSGRPGETVNSQQYGLLVGDGPTGTILVLGCDLIGYTPAAETFAVMVTGTPPHALLVCDCAGYNDQNTALNGSLPPTSSLNAATSSVPYFGPSVITFMNASPVTLYIFGQAFLMSFGAIYLPSPYDNFHFSSAPTYFSWVGK